MTGPRQSGRTTRQLEPLVGAAVYGEQCVYVCCSVNECAYLISIVLRIATAHGYPGAKIRVRGDNLIYFTSSGGRIGLMSRAQADRPDGLAGAMVDRLEQDHESAARNGPLSERVMATIRPKLSPTKPPLVDFGTVDLEQLRKTKEALDRLG